jgi:hypothetical protein
LPFGSAQVPLTFELGNYNVKVSIATSLAPCSNSPLIDRSVTIEPETEHSAVITLNEDGEPTARIFTNACREFPRQCKSSSRTAITSKTYTYTVNPGELLAVAVPACVYSVQIKQGTTTPGR